MNTNKQPSPQQHTAQRGSKIKAQTELFKRYSGKPVTPSIRSAPAYFTLPLSK